MDQNKLKAELERLLQNRKAFLKDSCKNKEQRTFQGGRILELECLINTFCK